jgi:hypothetical protein
MVQDRTVFVTTNQQSSESVIRNTVTREQQNDKDQKIQDAFRQLQEILARPEIQKLILGE